jgi:hypothetical protein
MLSSGDAAILDNVAPDVFDDSANPARRAIGLSRGLGSHGSRNSPAMRLYGSIGGEEAPAEQVMFTFSLNSAGGVDR